MRTSERDKQIIELIQQGQGNKQIAAELGKSEQRIKDLIHKLFRKHGCKNRTELAMKFREVA